MSDILHMAWRYLRYHRFKSMILVASVSLVIFLPLGLQMVVRRGAEMLTSRADATPLLVGARGSATDLTLSALYFRAPAIDGTAYREVMRINESGLGFGIPLHLRFQAGAQRIVGTSPEYFDLRGLELAAGRPAAMLGECVVGARAAGRLGVGVGGHVLSTPAGAFDVAGSFPLKMSVVGVLAPSGGPDDEAVFVDVKTAWIIEGLAHGHMDMQSPDAEAGVLRRDGGNVVANASVLSYTEITPENLDSFHFHGDPAGFPVDAVIVVPADRKSGIMLRGRYEADAQAVQMLVPRKVIDGLLETVFSVRDLIVLGSLGVLAATVAITILVFALSIRLRQREIATIRKIGGPRRRLWAILSTEILMVLGMALLIAVGLTMIVGRFGGVLLQLLNR